MRLSTSLSTLSPNSCSDGLSTSSATPVVRSTTPPTPTTLRLPLSCLTRSTFGRLFNLTSAWPLPSVPSSPGHMLPRSGTWSATTASLTSLPTIGWSSSPSFNTLTGSCPTTAPANGTSSVVPSALWTATSLTFSLTTLQVLMCCTTFHLTFPTTT